MTMMQAEICSTKARRSKLRILKVLFEFGRADLFNTAKRG